MLFILRISSHAKCGTVELSLDIVSGDLGCLGDAVKEFINDWIFITFYCSLLSLSWDDSCVLFFYIFDSLKWLPLR